MEPMITEDKISLWLVTLPDGNHYVMATLSVDTPHRAKFENDEIHEPYDAWDVEECAFILPISNSNLPHYLRNHCWEDEPMEVMFLNSPSLYSLVSVPCLYFLFVSVPWYVLVLCQEVVSSKTK